MVPEDAKAFGELVRNVHSFYGKDASTFTIDVWWGAMKHYDLAAVRDALSRHCVNPDNGHFLPRPADVVRMLEGSTLDSAVFAWTKVDRALQSVGTYATVAFDDPLIHRVLEDMGGWTYLGQKSTDEWPFVAKEFQTRYRGYKAQRARPEYPPKLIGLVDAANTKQGFREGEVVLIGDARRAQAVLAAGSNVPRIPMTRMSELAQLPAVQVEDGNKAA